MFCRADVMSRFMSRIELLRRNGYGASAGEGFSLVLAPAPVQIPGPQAAKMPPLLTNKGIILRRYSTFLPVRLSVFPFYLLPSNEATSSANQARCREEDSTMSPPSDDSHPDHLLCYFRFNPSPPPGRLPCSKD